MYSTFQQSYIMCYEIWQIDIPHYSQYYFSFEKCNYKMSPTTPVFVESTIYNCNFCQRETPIA